MHNQTISLRRRQLMITGAVGTATVMAAPSLLAAPCVSATGDEKTLVLSGRVVGADGKPLSGAAIDVQHTHHGHESARTTTDADGRFMLTIAAPAARAGEPRSLRYRISHNGKALRSSQIYFTQQPGDFGPRVAQLQHDEAGTLRTAFGVTLA